MIRICQICNKEFNIYPSQIKRGRGKYCAIRCRGIARRGKNHPMFDKLVSVKTRRKISKALENGSIERGKKISEANKGKTTWMKDKHHSEKTKKLNSLAHSGDKAFNWKGGISNNPYPRKFNIELKLKIRTRDNFTCCLCNRTEREELEELNRVLCVNHIDFDKNNCKKENLNTLCLRCNVKINREREYWTNYFNN